MFIYNCLKLAGNKAPNDELFDLSERQQLLVKRSIALPKVSSWILQCIAEGTTDYSCDIVSH